MKNFLSICQEALQAWSADKASRIAAALAYYTIFSLAPLLVILVVIAGQVLGQADVQEQIIAQLEVSVGEETAGEIESLMATREVEQSGVFATIISLLLMLLGASSVFGQLQGAFDTIWKVGPDPERGIVGVIIDRLFAFLMVLVIGLLLIGAFLVSAAISAANNLLEGVIPASASLLYLADLLISLILITLLFALIFKILARVSLSWKDALVGSFVTALLFVLGKYAIGLYLGNAGVGSAFGAAGSLVMILLWIYYAAQIFLLGAEFTKVYARRRRGAGSGERGAVNNQRLTTNSQQSTAKEQDAIPHTQHPTLNTPHSTPPTSHTYMLITSIVFFAIGVLISGRRK